MKRKNGEKRERTGRIEKEGCKFFSQRAHPLTNACACQGALKLRPYNLISNSNSFHCTNLGIKFTVELVG